MKWRKMGLIYGPDGSSSWAKHSALTPRPLLVDERIIRVYAGFRDEQGVSRIGFVEVDADNPSKVLNVSKKPALDVGIPGCFDDNGVILGDIVRYENKVYMYYAGFQLVQKVKFLAFTGLAISNRGDTFERYAQAPVLDRSGEGIYFRVIHSVIFEGNIWKIWYAVGNEWTWIDQKPFPSYYTKYLESKDGIHFPEKGLTCLSFQKDEYRVGAPRVFKERHQYRMFYTKGTLSQSYLPGYAESDDGRNWTRRDDSLGIKPSQEGWDSEMLCYPAFIRYRDRAYLFYNGNDYGKDGFGYAVLEEG